MSNRLIGGLLALGLFALPFADMAMAQGANIRVGIVRMNEVLNRSEAGKRSKGILLASKEQKENELKAKEEQLKKLRSELEANIMLSKEAREAKENELRQKLGELRKELQEAQIGLQTKERKLTEDIYKELKTVIQKIAEKEKYDFVIDESAAQVIVFSKYEFEDITDKVLASYNKLNQ